MGILLAFAPFIAFAVIVKIWSGTMALFVGACVSAIPLARDLLGRRQVKILEAGTFLIFSGLALMASLTPVIWSAVETKWRVDAGLLCIVLISMMIRQPFTLQYASEEAPPEIWNNQAFIRANFIITMVWALAFAAMVAADVLMVYQPHLPSMISIAVTIAALLTAYKFTARYRQMGRRRQQVSASLEPPAA
jgi:hypothetical protein